ncbi:MAG: hypothetical protein EZS28_002192 [Streblomastix strix]|uniref:SPRY domain-containing protein n=1 Tax=Streblomastix strix TaxID=222440 RepID=A0A5J4X513_9EUKA|nr:MAG: hypothetical protein EZS28_002192 [Streblomastix strix]
MSDLIEYNVEGGILGLGEFILLEIAFYLIDLEDVQQVVSLCKKTFKLKDHVRFHKSIDNKINIPISITIPTYYSEQYTKKENEFTYTSKNFGCKTFPIDQIITNGLYRCEFKVNKAGSSFGVMKSGLIIPFGKGCGWEPQAKDTAYQNQEGYLYQNRSNIGGNQELKDGDIVAIEVNMAPPRTATLFTNGKQQPVFVNNIPESVQFFFTLSDNNYSTTVLSLKRLEASTSANITGAKEVKWA